MGVVIDIAVEHEAWRSVGDIDALAARAVNAALAESGTTGTNAELSLVLCDDAYIRDLNRDWRGKDKPTNVLSFPADPSARRLMLGDIVVAYETTAREAEDEGKAVGDHLAHLIVHGVLHLLGYGHETETEADAMENLEVRVLKRLRIASPYGTASSLREPV